MMDSLPSAYVAFSLERTRLTAGRIRIRVPGRFKDERFFSEVAEDLRRLPGVLDVNVNAKTTSILVEHESDEATMLAGIQQVGRFNIVAHEEIPLRHQFAAFPVFSQKEKDTMKVLALIALSGVQVARGHALGAGTSLLDEAFRYWDRLTTITTEARNRNG